MVFLSFNFFLEQKNFVKGPLAQPPPPAAPTQDPPARPLGPSLRHTAAAFPFACSTGSKATCVCVSQRHTHRHGGTEGTPTWPVTPAATGKALTAPTYRTGMKHQPRQPSPLLLFSWQRQEVTGESMHTRTRHSLSSQAHTHLQTPSRTSTAPLSVQRPCPDPGPSYLPHRSLTRQEVLLEACQRAQAHAHPPGLGETRLPPQQLAPGTQARTHSPTAALGAQPLTRLTPFPPQGPGQRPPPGRSSQLQRPGVPPPPSLPPAAPNPLTPAAGT